MKSRCAFCGRLTEPYAFIGSVAVGPSCARSHNITPAKVSRGGHVKFCKPKPGDKREDEQLDLFQE